jgi:hypothetical protein
MVTGILIGVRIDFIGLPGVLGASLHLGAPHLPPLLLKAPLDTTDTTAALITSATSGQFQSSSSRRSSSGRNQVMF